MVNIWLDDVRPAPVGWLWAMTSYDCIKFLTANKGNVNILSLDHDLGDDARFGTGYTVCKHLTGDKSILPRKIYLHTANPVGRENMYGRLINFKEVFDLDFQVYRGPEINSWEESMAIAKELGYF